MNRLVPYWPMTHYILCYLLPRHAWPNKKRKEAWSDVSPQLSCWKLRGGRLSIWTSLNQEQAMLLCDKKRKTNFFLFSKQKCSTVFLGVFFVPKLSKLGLVFFGKCRECARLIMPIKSTWNSKTVCVLRFSTSTTTFVLEGKFSAEASIQWPPSFDFPILLEQWSSTHFSHPANEIPVITFQA